jgi:hypothetical protein
MRTPRLDAIRAVLSRLTVWLTPRRRVQAARAAIVLLAAVLAVRGLRDAVRTGGGPPDLGDSAAYIAAARGVLAGDLLPSYEAPRPYQYPPTLAVLIAPLGLLPDRAASIAWTLGSLAFLLLAIRRLPGALGEGVAPLDVLLGLLLSFRAFESDFANRNANVLVFSLLILGFSEARRGKERWGGAILGLAAAIKVTPILLLLWIAVMGRGRQALGFTAGLAFAGVVFPILVLGPGPYGQALEAFYWTSLRPIDAASETYRDEPGDGYVPGQSLRALLHRLLRESDATPHDRKVVRVNVVDLPKMAVDVIFLGAAVASAVALLLRFWRWGGHWSGPEVGAVLAAMVFLAPMSRKAHFVAVLPAAAMAFEAIRAIAGTRRKALAVLWGTAFALMTLTAPALLGRQAATLALAFCPFGVAAGLLAAACALAGGRATPASPRSCAGRASPSPSPPPQGSRPSR